MASSTNGTVQAGLTPHQIHRLLITERTMSIISLIATILVIVLFLCIAELKRKTFNRLLFLASWGNILTNIATLIGRAGIQAGTKSATCKVQATLIQWFIPTDSLWMACMAVNVFLTFQTTTIQVNLQKLEKWYCLIGYGIPGVPAITYLLLDVTRGTDYYGDATLWCWISTKHDSLRIITFYGPVWIILLVTMTLYAVTGRAIYKGQVRNPTIRDQIRDTPSPEDRYGMYIADDAPINQMIARPKETVTSHVSEKRNSKASKENRTSSTSSYTLTGTISPTPDHMMAEDNRISTFTHISDSRQSHIPPFKSIEIPGFGDGTNIPDHPYPVPAIPHGIYPAPPTTVIESTEQLPLPIPRSALRPCDESSDSSSDSSSEATPAPAGNASEGFNALKVQQTATSSSNTAGGPSRFGSISKSWSPRLNSLTPRLNSLTPRLSSLTSHSTATRTNQGARTYARVAFLLYLTILIVWVPSTVNRIYGLTSKGHPNYALNLAAALVLPTQGLFNAFVFCFTSRNELAKRIRNAYHGKWKSDINKIREVHDEEDAHELNEPRSKSVMEV